MKNFIKFLHEKGRSLDEMHLESPEIALTAEDAIFAIEILKEELSTIVGGDILSEENNRLGYILNLWGYQYHYLSWSCDKNKDESEENYRHRSYDVARKSILSAISISEKLKKNVILY